MPGRDPSARHEPEDRARYDESTHPDRTVDDLEDQILGQRYDQQREEPAEGIEGSEPT